MLGFHDMLQFRSRSHRGRNSSVDAWLSVTASNVGSHNMATLGNCRCQIPVLLVNKPNNPTKTSFKLLGCCACPSLLVVCDEPVATIPWLVGWLVYLAIVAWSSPLITWQLCPAFWQYAIGDSVVGCDPCSVHRNVSHQRPFQL